MATDDAYLRAVRANNWRTAQLRAHGIEPWSLSPDAPHDPPLSFDFGAPQVEDLVWMERTIHQLCDFLKIGQDGTSFAGVELKDICNRASRAVEEWRGTR